jgi:WD40 repeat protein
MSESITQQGILVHVDLADSCRQGDKIGLVSTDDFYRWLENQLRERFQRRGFEFVKSMGDASLFFGQKPEEIPALILDLFIRHPIPKRLGFQVELRAVAGSGWFQLRPGADRKYVDAIGPEVNKVFRLDKHGRPDHFLVRSDLRDPIAHLLPQWGITEEEVEAPPLKGFEKYGPVLCFLLKPPSIGLDGEPMPESFERARNALRAAAQQIQVLGGLGREMAMEPGFIPLTLESMAQDPPAGLGAWDVFAQRRHGIIFGPPGSGKSTILRYYAFRALRENPEAFAIFIRGGDFNPEDVPSKDASMEEVWQALTGAFLFPAMPKSRRSSEEQTEVETTARIFQNAWRQGLVVLLIDELSKVAPGATDGAAHANLLKIVRRLFAEADNGASPKTRTHDNRLFVSVLASEERNLELRGLPSFRVRELSLEEIHQLAANLYEVTPELKDPFRQAMARESGALFKTRTPLTATLAILYFQHYQSLPLRYGAYDLMMRFLIGNISRDLESETSKWITPGHLVEEMTSTSFLTRTTGLQLHYDAVSSLCYDHLYARSAASADLVIPDRACLDYFAGHFASAGSMNPPQAAEEARKLFDRLCAHQLLAPHRPGSHIFANSDLVEFLAARRLASVAGRKEEFAAAVQCVAQAEGAEGHETLPMLCGYKALGYQTLEAIRALPSRGGVQSSLPYRCLAETEAATAKLNLGFFYDAPRDERSITLRQWIRDRVSRLLMDSETAQLHQWAANYKSCLLLPAEALPDNAPLRPEPGSPGLAAARRMVLEKLFSPAAIEASQLPLDTSSAAPPAAAASELCLTLDRPGHPDDKNFGYHARRIGSGLIGFLGSPNLLQGSAVRAVAVAPGDLFIASGGANGTVRIWDSKTGREILALEKHAGPVEACAWSPKNGFLATASSDALVIIWEIPSGTIRHILQGHAGSVNSCSWSPDGLLLASASADKTLQIWDAATGRPAQKLAGHQAAVASCAWSPDGKLLVSGSWDQTVRIWNPHNGTSLTTLSGMTATVKACAWSPDSKRVASVSDQSVKIHELPRGREIMALTGHKSAINACAWPLEGKTLATASADQTIKIWEISSASERLTLCGHRGAVETCAWAPDGSFLASGSADASIKIWEMPAGKERFQFGGHRTAATACAWSPDGARLASSARDQTLKIWAWPAGNEVRVLAGHKGSVDTCAWSPDGTTLASGSRDKTIKLWAMPEGKETFTLAGHTGNVLVCAWSPKDGALASVSWDSTIRLWETTWGKEVRVLKEHQDAVFACAWSPNGLLLATGSNDRSLKIWDAASGKALHSWVRHDAAIECCAWAPDQKRLITGASNGLIKLWKMPEGTVHAELAGHKSAVLTCACSAQGNLLVSGSHDQTIKIWDLARGEELLTVSLGWTPRHIQFAPTRPHEFAVAGETGVIALFDMPRALESC